ncbi:MAG: hypothetical protein ABW061_05220 [Polyangiaceae bacterium]
MGPSASEAASECHNCPDLVLYAMREDWRAAAVFVLAGLGTHCGSSSDSGGNGSAGAAGNGNSAAGNGNAAGAAGNAAGAAGNGNGAAGNGNAAGAAGGNAGSGNAAGNSNMAGATSSNGGSGNGAAGAATVVGGSANGDWVNVTANLAGLSTMCGNTGLIVAKPDKDEIIAAVALHGLYSTVDAGKTWTPISGSQKLTASASQLLFDPKDSGHYWVVGNHALPVMVETADNGETFTTQGNGAYIGLDYLGIDFSDPKRNLLVVGAHEIAQAVSLSTDGGATWTPIGAKLPASVYCTAPYVVDSKTFLVGCADGQIQRTTDSGATWTKVSSKGSNRGPLLASDGSLYWPCTDGSLVRTTNGGADWADVLKTGTLGTPFPPVELPDGRVAAIAKDGIVAGKADGGVWAHVAPTLPSDPYTMTYSAPQKAFYYGHGDCMMVVPSNAIMRFPFDYTKN